MHILWSSYLIILCNFNFWHLTAKVCQKYYSKKNLRKILTVLKNITLIYIHNTCMVIKFIYTYYNNLPYLACYCHPNVVSSCAPINIFSNILWSELWTRNWIFELFFVCVYLCPCLCPVCEFFIPCYGRSVLVSRPQEVVRQDGLLTYYRAKPIDIW